MNILGNLDLSGHIVKLKLKGVESLPTFDADDSGVLFFDLSEKTLVLNNGDTYLTLKTEEASTGTLRNTLGENWINSNLTFNPTDFNGLNNINGLDGNSTLFDVIAQLDSKVSSLKVDDINDIDNVESDDLSINDILYYDGSNYINGSINNIKSELNLSVNDLSDVDAEVNKFGDTIIYNGSQFITAKTTYVYQNLTGTASVFVINHQLDFKYVDVLVINSKTDREVTETAVEYLSDSSLRLTLKENTSVTVIVKASPYQI